MCIFVRELSKFRAKTTMFSEIWGFGLGLRCSEFGRKCGKITILGGGAAEPHLGRLGRGRGGAGCVQE